MSEHIDKINTERKLDFANLPSFQDLTDKEGRIYLNGERIILTSSTVFGILRKELKEN
ncbi:XylR N-terminal domain-containing protein, partial [Virgibacillus salexigens]|uniref:XylR N-terminal domain-containing protein n=1 Tax=Virgibacillus massiliensis TaxID=1462526 RepID=UPI0018E0E5B6